jgi:sensor histidine kinase YesM
MEVNLPIGRLLRLNLLLAIIISAIVYLALLQDKNQHHALLFTVMSIVSISLISFTNVLILVLLNNAFGRNQKKVKLFRYLTSYPASVAVYLIIYPIFASFSKNIELSHLQIRPVLILIFSGCLINTLVIILHDLILLQSEKINAELELSRAKTAHAEAAVLLLRQQIHPHFLFNALNMLKSLYKMDTKAGDTYIVHLANFLRASMFNGDTEVTTLENELKLLVDYLEMQKIRFGMALACSINITGEQAKSSFLPSFCLQPLLENAIKHNELTEEHPLYVSIYIENGYVWTTNNFQPKKNIEQSTNSGLANLAERYKLLSEDEIIISVEKGKFIVGIKLLTHEYSNHRR